MIAVTQTEVGVDNPRANCLMAAVASILEVPLESLPDVYDEEQRGLSWVTALQHALKPHGLVPVIYDQASDHFPSIAPKGYHIACGISPRDGKSHHAMVALDGVIVHDPHPTRAGTTEIGITWWILLLPLASEAS